MLTSKVRERIELPHEPGEWIEIRQLSKYQLDEARERKAELNMAGSRRFIEFSVLRKQFEADTPPVEAPKPETEATDETPVTPEPEPDPLIWLDDFTLLKYGVVAWSYPDKVSMENIADLDEETVRYVAGKLAPKPRTEATLPLESAPSTTQLRVVESTPVGGSTAGSAKKDSPAAS